jgi:hypothetical protein
MAASCDLYAKQLEIMAKSSVYLPVQRPRAGDRVDDCHFKLEFLDLFGTAGIVGNLIYFGQDNNRFIASNIRIYTWID